jgi:O-antigen/teichoic acid export membrane protein
MLIAILPGVIGSVIAPAIIQEGGKYGDARNYEKLFDKSFAALMFLLTPSLIGLLFLSDGLFLIYGRDYGDSFRIFMPLTTSIAIGVIGSLSQFALVAKSRTWWLMIFGAIKSVLLIALAKWLIPGHMAAGLAWAMFASDFFFYLLLIEFCNKTKAIPSSARKRFYLSSAVFIVILILALRLPDMVRWGTAIPLSLISAFISIKIYPTILEWLSSMIPQQLQPPVRKIFSFIAS